MTSPICPCFAYLTAAPEAPPAAITVVGAAESIRAPRTAAASADFVMVFMETPFLLNEICNEEIIEINAFAVNSHIPSLR